MEETAHIECNKNQSRKSNKKNIIIITVLFILLFIFVVFIKNLLVIETTNGKAKLCYSKKHGIFLLYTFHENYQKGKSSGFAIENLPVIETSAMFLFQREKIDSEILNNVLELYQFLAKWGDNDYADIVLQILNSNSIASLQDKAKSILNSVSSFNLWGWDIGSITKFIDEEFDINSQGAVSSVLQKADEIDTMISEFRKYSKILKTTKSQNIGNYGRYFLIDFNDLLNFDIAEKWFCE